MERIYKAKFYDIKHFKMACEILSKTMENCTFKFSNTDVSIVAISDSLDTLIKITFDNIELMCHKPSDSSIIYLGISLKHLMKRLNKIVPGTPYVALTVNKNNEEYGLYIQNKLLVKAETVKTELPRMEFNNRVTIETTKLLNIIEHIKPIITIECGDNEVFFKGEPKKKILNYSETPRKIWKYARTPITNYLNGACKSDTKINSEYKPDTKTSGTYSIACLSGILDPTLSPSVDLYLKNDFPLTIVTNTGCGKQYLFISQLQLV